MKRLLFLAGLIAGLPAFVFAGGQKESGASASSQAPITLVAWNVFDPAQSQDAVRLEEKYAEYHKLHPNITIKHNVYVYADLRQKAIVAAQGGQGPDLLHMLGEWVPDFVRLGIIQDITSQAKSWSDFDKFPPSTWKVATDNGKIYGVPSIASTRVLLYRDDLFQKYGVTVPKTWTDLRAAAKKLTIDTSGDGKPDIYGFAFCSSSQAIRGPQEFAVLLWSTGGDLVKQDGGKWVPGFTPEQARDVYQLYYDMMFTDQSAPPFSIGWEYQELDSGFQANTLAMAQDGAWMRRRAEQSDTGKSWKTAPFPYEKVPATYLEVKVEGIGKYSQNAQAAWDFDKWLYSRDNMVYITQVDNLPSRIDSTESQYWISDPIWRKTFLDTVPDGHAMPPIPFGPALKLTMDDLQEVLYKRMSPAQAGQDFYNKVKNYLDTSVNN